MGHDTSPKGLVKKEVGSFMFFTHIKGPLSFISQNVQCMVIFFDKPTCISLPGELTFIPLFGL